MASVRLKIAAITFTVLLSIQASHLAFGDDRLRFTKAGTHPSDSELGNVGATNAQGIAFDGLRWFYSNRTSISRLSREFTNRDRFVLVHPIIPPTGQPLGGLRFGGAWCGHVGGIDFHDGELYVALDNCTDRSARIAIFDQNLFFKRSAVLPELHDSFPWVAVNPIDKLFYAVSPDGGQLLAFPRDFQDGDMLNSDPNRAIRFLDKPQQVLAHFWEQGAAFSRNGLLFRVVDDAKGENSVHTGVWVYEIDRATPDRAVARRVGFINIRYDPDWPLFGRRQELEDVDVASIADGATAGDVHVMMLSNQVDEGNVSILHYWSGDYDGDGVRDTLDNCLWVPNALQLDFDRNGIGTACDPAEIARFFVPTIMMALG